MRCVAFSPQGDKVVTGGDFKRVMVFSPSGEKLWESEALGGAVNSVAWSPQGDKIAAGVGHRVIVFSSSSGEKLWESGKLGSCVNSVAFSPQGDKIAAGVGNGRVAIFSSSDGSKLRESEKLGGPVFCVAWSPQGDKIAAGGNFKRVVIFSSSSGRKLWETSDLGAWVYSVAWSPQGDKIAAGVGHRVIVFSSSSGEKLWESGDLGGYVYSVAFSPQGDKIAAGVEWIDKVVVFSSSGTKLWESPDLGDEVRSVAWSPQGDKIAVGGDFGRVVVFSVGLGVSLGGINDVCGDVLGGVSGLVGVGLRCACSGDWGCFAGVLEVWGDAPLVVNGELLLHVASLFSPLEVRGVLGWFEWFGGEFGVSVDSDGFLDGVVERLISCKDGESLVRVSGEFRGWVKGLLEVLHEWRSWYWDLDEEVRGAVKEFVRVATGGSVLGLDGLRGVLEDAREFVRVLGEGVEGLRPEVDFVGEGVAGEFSRVGVRVCFGVGVPGVLSLVGAEVGGGGEVRVPKQGFRVDPRSKCVEVPLHVLARVPGEVPINLKFRFSGPGGIKGEFVRTASLRVVPRASVSVESGESEGLEGVGSGGEGVGVGLGGPAESVGPAGVVGADSLGFPEVLRRLFEPLEFLGEGGFGRVWKVRRVSDGSVSAVKIPIISSPELGRVFLREVSVWLRLKHRNIVGLRDANVVPVPYLEMEFVPGAVVEGRLVRCLEDLPKPVEPGLAVKLFEGVAAGVAYAHSVGVIHRDLKPLNVLLDEDLTPKVSDWGLAKLAAMTTSRVGLKAYSPAYAAPEQIDEETYGGTDERTDIYQLGLMLYELLTGRLPYEASTPAALTAKVIREDVAPVPPSKHSPELKPFDAPILKALSKRKELRYSRVEDFMRDVREALRKYLSAAGEDLEAVRREVEEVKRTLRKSVRRGASKEEVRALKARYAELLGKYAVAALREGEVEEAIEGLEELVYYTRKHEEELAKLIQEVEVMVRSDAPITEGLIKRVKLLTAKIVAETRGGK